MTTRYELDPILYLSSINQS